MTVATTATFEMTRDGIIRRAYQLCGALDSSQSPSANDISLASDLLGMELDFLQAEGIMLRTVERTTLALTLGTATYSLPTDTIDIMVEPDTKAGVVWVTAGSETIVRSISRADYESLGNKSVQGMPTMCLHEKLATQQVTFWPIPYANMTFRYAKVRLLKDADPGNVTMDLTRKWQKPLTYSLAWQLGSAKGVDLNKIGFLRNTADELRRVARADDHQRGHAQLCITRWGY